MNTTQTPQKESDHFNHLFWFCAIAFIVGVACILLLIFCDYPDKHRDMANAMIGFFSTGVVATVLAFLFAGSIPTGKKQQPGTTTVTADISASVASEEKTK